MKCTKIKIGFILLSISLLSCSKDNSPFSTSNNSITILDYSFEGNGSGGLQGWRFGDSLAKDFFYLSNDVPPDGGSWSLLMITDTSKSRELIYTIKPPPLSSSKVINLSFNVKSIGNILGFVDLTIWGSNVEYAPTIMLGKFDNWGTVSHKMGSATMIDSIVIDLNYRFGSQYYGQMWFDNIKVEELPK